MSIIGGRKKRIQKDVRRLSMDDGRWRKYGKK